MNDLSKRALKQKTLALTEELKHLKRKVKDVSDLSFSDECHENHSVSGAQCSAPVHMYISHWKGSLSSPPMDQFDSLPDVGEDCARIIRIYHELGRPVIFQHSQNRDLRWGLYDHLKAYEQRKMEALTPFLQKLDIDGLFCKDEGAETGDTLKFFAEVLKENSRVYSIGLERLSATNSALLPFLSQPCFSGQIKDLSFNSIHCPESSLDPLITCLAQGSRQFRKLNFNETVAESIPFEKVAELVHPQLESLHLTHKLICQGPAPSTDRLFEAIATKGSGLKSLHMGNSNALNAGDINVNELIEAVENSQAPLEEISLRIYELGRLDPNHVPKLIKAAGVSEGVLRRLDLSGSCIGEEGLEQIATALCLPTCAITHLNLSKSHIIERDVEVYVRRCEKHINNGSWLRALVTAPMAHIAHQKRLRKNDLGPLEKVLLQTKSLRHLNLTDIPIRHETQKSFFEALSINKSLEELNLSGCELSDFESLAQALSQNSTLRFLKISGVKLEAQQLDLLFRALELNSTLEDLDLGFCVKDQFALSKQFSNNPNLSGKTLSFGNCKRWL